MEYPWAMLDAATLGVGGPVIKPSQPGKRDGGGTHRTRLQRHVEGAVRQSGFTPKGAGLPDHLHLRMGSGVRQLFGPVTGPGQDFTRAIDDNGADGHLVTGASRLGFFQGQVHEG